MDMGTGDNKNEDKDKDKSMQHLLFNNQNNDNKSIQTY